MNLFLQFVTCSPSLTVVGGTAKFNEEAGRIEKNVSIPGPSCRGVLAGQPTVYPKRLPDRAPHGVGSW